MQRAQPVLKPHPTPPRPQAGGELAAPSAPQTSQRGRHSGEVARRQGWQCWRWEGTASWLRRNAQLRQRETQTTARQRLQHTLPVAKGPRFANVPCEQSDERGCLCTPATPKRRGQGQEVGTDGHQRTLGTCIPWPGGPQPRQRQQCCHDGDGAHRQ